MQSPSASHSKVGSPVTPTSPGTPQTVAAIIERVKQIGAVNHVFVERIKAKKTVNLVRYSLQSNLEQPLPVADAQPLCFKEWKVEQDAQKLVQEFKPKIQLETVDDLFNDHIDYTCASFADVARLNEALPKTAKKFDMLNEEKALPMVTSLLTNMQRISACLSQLDGSLIDQRSYFNELQAEYIHPITDMLRNAAEKMRKLNNSGKPIEVRAMHTQRNA